jgi:Yip1 domain
MSDPIAPPTATGEEMSTAETLTGIFFEPSRTFEALRSRPRFLVAGLILFILTTAVTLSLYARVDMAQFIRDRIEQSPRAAQVSEEQKETQVRIGKIIGMVFIPLAVPVMIAGGAALYLLGVMAFGGSISYKKSLAVWCYSWLPQALLGTLIALLVLFLKSPDTIVPENLVATNPAALMSTESSKVLLAFLRQFDLLRFLGMFLAALGLRKVGKLSSGSAWGVVILLWLIGLLLAVGSAAIFGG